MYLLKSTWILFFYPLEKDTNVSFIQHDQGLGCSIQQILFVYFSRNFTSSVAGFKNLQPDSMDISKMCEFPIYLFKKEDTECNSVSSSRPQSIVLNTRVMHPVFGYLAGESLLRVKGSGGVKGCDMAERNQARSFMFL